jgi:hypothetical protein
VRMTSGAGCLHKARSQDSASLRLRVSRTNNFGPLSDGRRLCRVSPAAVKSTNISVAPKSYDYGGRWRPIRSFRRPLSRLAIFADVLLLDPAQDLSQAGGQSALDLSAVAEAKKLSSRTRL